MPETKHEQKRCNIHRDGVCALHGVEVERRQNSVNQLEQAVKPIPWLMTMVNRGMGYLGLISLIVAGLAIYTRDGKIDQKQYASRHESQFIDVNKQISNLTAATARNEGRYLTTISQLNSLNLNIERMLNNNEEDHRKMHEANTIP